jgi:hypothetical protein
VTTPRITVVLPVHNGEAWIRECVGSLARQTSPAHEIIVVDDGSADGTADAVRDLPVRLISLDSNRGRASARNAGLEAATGELIVFAEDDGLYPPHYLERLTSPFADPAIAGAIGPYRVLRPDTWITRCRDAERAIHFANYSPFTAWAYRTADVRRLGGFDQRLEVAEDVDLGRRVARECGRIAWVPGALWYHREPAGLWRFLRRRFRAGAGSLLDRMRPGRPLVPRRAMAALLAVPAAGALTAFTAGDVVWAPAAGLALLPLLPPVLRARFVAGAREAGVRTSHAIGWTYLELAGWAAAAAGSVWALALGPARVHQRLRGR